MTEGTVTIYRGIPHKETVTAPALAGHSTVRAVWCWRRSTCASDWRITKSHALNSNTVLVTLTSSETASLPFYTGARDLYYVEDSTGLFTLLRTDEVKVVDLTSAGNGGGASSFEMRLGFNVFGVARQGDFAVGIHTLRQSAVIERIELSCGVAPLGAALTFEIYVDNNASGITGSIAAGTTSNVVDVSLPVVSGNVLQLKIVSVGTPPREGENASITLVARAY